MSFVVSNQFFVFLCSIGFGCIIGFLFSIKNVIKKRLNNKALKIFCDVLVFILCAFCFNYLSFVIYFPNFRVYILLGFFVGIYVHLKSFNLILAKINKKIYNIIKNKRESNNERIKG